MQGSAILVVSNRFADTAAGSRVADVDQGEPARAPTACVEVLGQSVLERTVTLLRQEGIKAISVIAEANFVSPMPAHDLEITIARQASDCWSVATRTLKRHAAQGVEDVLVMGLGAYIECDLPEVLQFHRAKRSSLTQLLDSQQPLDFWIVDADLVGMPERDFPLPFNEDKTLSPIPYRVKGYVNRLADAADLRRLVVDAFLARCAIRPRGREIRPGVWLDDGARPHRSARIVAPAYLGRCAKLGPSVIMTRFSNVERNCRVGAGTVVDSASILAHTALGRGLDVSQAVVDGNEFVDLGRNLAVRIDDPNLLRDTSPRPRRVLEDQRDHGEPLAAGHQAFEPEYAQYLSPADSRALGDFQSEV